MNWVPNRKVLAGFVGGAFAWGLMQFFGIDLPDDIDIAFGVFVASLIGYWVPLPSEPPVS